jgi:GNAT superfamily N-acetyltransferase
MKGPSVAVRQEQWREAFANQDKNWFCFVVARPGGDLVGFAKGVRRDDHEYVGELNKLYLLREYQRLGLGRRLFGCVVRRFINGDIMSMAAYVDPRNPSCWFFEALGGKWLREPDGRINFSWYVWPNLRWIVARCPVE